MGKTKEEHNKEITEVIIKHRIMCIDHIFSHYLDLKPSQFYNLELQKSENIKDAIHTNKSKGASYLLNKFIQSDNPTLQISAFKIICSDEQRKKLSMQYLESDNKHEINTFEIEILNGKSKDTD